MVFRWCLSDNKSLQVSRNLLRILADINNAVVWIVITRPLTPKSFCLCINSLVIVPSAPIIIGITVNVMLHSFFFFQFSSKNWVVVSLFFSFTQWSAGTVKSTIQQVLFFCWLSLGLVVWRRLSDPFVSQNPKDFSASHFLGRILGYVYTMCSYGQI